MYLFLGHEHNFDKAKKSKTNDFGVVYDYNSIMHYSSKAFSNNGERTIIPKVSNYITGRLYIQKKIMQMNTFSKLVYIITMEMNIGKVKTLHLLNRFSMIRLVIYYYLSFNF